LLDDRLVVERTNERADVSGNFVTPDPKGTPGLIEDFIEEVERESLDTPPGQ
jgi:hypothetical protein